MFKRLSIFILICICSNLLIGQSRIGTWEDHVSFNGCLSVCKFNGKMYGCNYSSLLIYNDADQSYEKLSKINGLSDVGIHLLRDNPYNNRLMVIYENSNMDIIKSDNSISNYSDLFRKNFSGKKTVNEVLFVGKMAYLSCGFGIALFDTEKLEIKETYIIGPNGTNLEVYQIAMTDSIMYAATPLGLYKCNYKTKLMNNYQNWQLISSGLPAGCYANIIQFNNNLLTVYSPYKQSGITDQDTVYQYTGTNWIKFPFLGNTLTIKKMKATGSHLAFINQFGTIFFGNTLNLVAEAIAKNTGYREQSGKRIGN